MLNDKERKKYDTIKFLVEFRITRKEAAISLGITLRQIDRLKNVFIKEGEKGFMNKNRNLQKANKIPEKTIEKLINMYLDEYYDFSLTAFYEKIENEYKISYSVLLNEFKKRDVISPYAHKNTIKLYNENMKEAIKNETISKEKEELFESRILLYEQAKTRKSCNFKCFGEEVQIDACEFNWFGEYVTYLHLAVDKATKKVLFGWFEYQEVTRGYFVILYNIIINYGIPLKIKSDNRSSFTTNRNKGFTQFNEICNTLGILLETSSVPTFKANVERENGTIKRRLKSELRLKNIVDIDEANEYLNKIFIPDINSKFSYKINEKTSKMKINNFSEEELKLIISEKTQRIIDTGSCISYNNKYYIPTNSETGEIVAFKNKTVCTLIVSYDGDLWCMIESNYYKLTEIEKRDKVLEKENKNECKTINKYIPPKNHCWRQNMMLKKYVNGAPPQTPRFNEVDSQKRK